MCATGSRAVALVLAFAVLGSAADAPAIHQSVRYFSNAIAGSGFAITWSAEPRELPPDGETTLTIRFDGVANPDRVRRPNLAERPAFKANFREIRDGEPIAPDGQSISFTYRLRPRDGSVQAIPELAIGYYAPGQDRVAMKYLDEIPLVRSAIVAKEDRRPLDIPQRFLSVPEPGPAPPSRAAWIGLLSSFVAVPTIWIILWRRWHPEGVRLAKLRRVRSVRAALDGLDRAARSPDPAAVAVRVVHDYLASRFGAAAASPTPGDVARALEEIHFPEERSIEAVNWMRACDAQRFAGNDRRDPALAKQARAMILAWEDRP